MGDTGLEQSSKSSGNCGGRDQSGAESGARDAQYASIDPELAAVVDGWPTLSVAIKAGILAMVGAAK